MDDKSSLVSPLFHTDPRSFDRSDSREMTQIASDTQAEETAKMIRTMDEYTVVVLPDAVTHPGSRSAEGKRRLYRDNVRKKGVSRYKPANITLTDCNRLPVDDTMSSRDTNDTAMSPGSFQTSYFSHDDTIPDGTSHYIQRIYAREGFGTVTSNNSRQTVRTQNSAEDHISRGRCDIDGRSSSFLSNEQFIPIESFARDMSTTNALKQCNKYVLQPYNTFLKVIGWRSFCTTHNCWYKKIINALYPCFVLLMMLLTSVAQALLCFSRSKATEFPLNNDHNGSNITCEANITFNVFAGDVFIFTAYLWGLYICRFSDPEHLSSLIATVFLSYNTCVVRRSQRSLVIFLLFFLVMGLLWIVMSFGLSVARLFLFQYCNTSNHFQFLGGEISTDPEEYKAVIWSLSVFIVIGFVFFDLLYVAVILNYCSQCTLLHFYVINVCEKIRHKAYPLGDAVKEVYRVHEFLQILNGKVALITSLIFFLLVQGAISSYLDYMMVESDVWGIVVGLGNVIQWTLAASVPILLAARLTGTCKNLKKICLEVGARPFVYLDTPQLVIDSFLLYTLSTNYRAKLGCVPIHPEYVFAAVFVFVMILAIEPQFSKFQFAEWL